MKVVHTAQVTPHRCGLYETARDLVMAERALGIDARLLDPRMSSDDRGAPMAATAFAEQADVVVNHSALGPCEKMDKPIVHVMHGRPRSSFLLEVAGSTKVYTYLAAQAKDARFKAFVTLWPEYVPYWSAILPPEKVKAVPAPVNLSEWTPDGPSGYGFHGKGGEINVVCSDVWRMDVDPYWSVNAFIHFARKHPKAKLHLYGTSKDRQKWAPLLAVVKGAGALGELTGFVSGLANVYRAADMLLTPHRIATRTVREALACGCSVVMGPGNDYTPYTADPERLLDVTEAMERCLTDRRADAGGARDANRQRAERYFDPVATARAMKAILEEARGTNGIQ